MNIENTNFNKDIENEFSNCKGLKFTICRADFVMCKTETTNCYWSKPFGTSRLCKHPKAISFVKEVICQLSPRRSSIGN